MLGDFYLTPHPKMGLSYCCSSYNIGGSNKNPDTLFQNPFFTGKDSKYGDGQIKNKKSLTKKINEVMQNAGLKCKKIMWCIFKKIPVFFKKLRGIFSKRTSTFPKVPVLFYVFSHEKNVPMGIFIWPPLKMKISGSSTFTWPLWKWNYLVRGFLFPSPPEN